MSGVETYIFVIMKSHINPPIYNRRKWIKYKKMSYDLVLIGNGPVGHKSYGRKLFTLKSNDNEEE